MANAFQRGIENLLAGVESGRAREQKIRSELGNTKLRLTLQSRAMEQQAKLQREQQAEINERLEIKMQAEQERFQKNRQLKLDMANRKLEIDRLGIIQTAKGNITKALSEKVAGNDTVSFQDTLDEARVLLSSSAGMTGGLTGEQLEAHARQIAHDSFTIAKKARVQKGLAEQATRIGIDTREGQDATSGRRAEFDKGTLGDITFGATELARKVQENFGKVKDITGKLFNFTEQDIEDSVLDELKQSGISEDMIQSVQNAQAQIKVLPEAEGKALAERLGIGTSGYLMIKSGLDPLQIVGASALVKKSFQTGANVASTVIGVGGSLKGLNFLRKARKGRKILKAKTALQRTLIKPKGTKTPKKGLGEIKGKLELAPRQPLPGAKPPTPPSPLPKSEPITMKTIREATKAQGAKARREARELAEGVQQARIKLAQVERDAVAKKVLTTKGQLAEAKFLKLDMQRRVASNLRKVERKALAEVAKATRKVEQAKRLGNKQGVALYNRIRTDQGKVAQRAKQMAERVGKADAGKGKKLLTFEKGRKGKRVATRVGEVVKKSRKSPISKGVRKRLDNLQRKFVSPNVPSRGGISARGFRPQDTLSKGNLQEVRRGFKVVIDEASDRGMSPVEFIDKFFGTTTAGNMKSLFRRAGLKL